MPRQKPKGLNCDFLIVIDDRPRGKGPTRFMTLDMDGPPDPGLQHPADCQCPETLTSWPLSWATKAAHHIANHIERQRRNAMTGAVLLGGLASLSGADAGAVRNAQEIGATVGARTYSKEFELEADALGTVIAARAGYDPVRGAEFFNRIPDPGNRFLGTHPPNAQRIATVRRVAAGL
jgi:Putative Zn-dependent protease, contains TPR repeats